MELKDFGFQSNLPNAWIGIKRKKSHSTKAELEYNGIHQFQGRTKNLQHAKEISEKDFEMEKPLL